MIKLTILLAALVTAMQNGDEHVRSQDKFRSALKDEELAAMICKFAFNGMIHASVKVTVPIIQWN